VLHAEGDGRQVKACQGFGREVLVLLHAEGDDTGARRNAYGKAMGRTVSPDSPSSDHEATAPEVGYMYVYIYIEKSGVCVCVCVCVCV
jgi:hypothetical protein